MERFVKFIPTRGHTGHQLADLLFEFIEDNEISLKDLRGQSYDNASNMSGKYKSLQAIIKKRNHQAEYIPCVAHFLNLVRKCAAECYQSAVRFSCLFRDSMCFLQLQHTGGISLLMH